MGPAIALRLRQHLTLTPQVQQALRLLQMSAMEFQQEMEQALAANPFLEENPEAPAPLAAAKDAPVEELYLPHESRAADPSIANRKTGAARSIPRRACRSTCASSCACRAARS